jgi:hypothetical protein
MKSLRAWFGLMLSVVFSFIHGAAVASQAHFFLDGATNQWCSLRNQKAFIAILKKDPPDEFAVLTYSNGRLSHISDTVDTQDFAVYSDYFVDPSGVISKLKRQTKTFHGWVSMFESYQFRDGKPHKTEIKFLDLVTRKPVPKPDLLSPDPDQPFSSRLSDFPFFKLMQNPAVRTAAKLCVPG